MKKSKKIMALVLALSMVVMSGALAFADAEGDPSVGTTDTNTAADANTPVDEETNAADVPKESTEEVCEHDYIFSKFILCADPVIKLSKCSKCGAEKAEEDPTMFPAEHFVWDSTKVEIQPRTCEQDQLLEGTCIFCNEKLTITGEKAGHRLDKGYVSKKPTATTEGEYTRNCTECDHVEKKSIRKLTSEDEKVQIVVTIYMYEAVKNPYGPGYETSQKLGGKPIDTKSFSQYIEPFGSYELNLTELLGRNVRTTDSTISGVTHGGLKLISPDHFNFAEERITGTVGLPDFGQEKIVININAMTWHNFTQIRCHFQQPDGSWAMKADADGKAVGLRYEDTIKDTAVTYTPEQFDGYEYSRCEIGYFHNLGSTTGPGIVKEVPLTEKEMEKWGINVSTEGKVEGENINFFANKQLFINYYYALPFTVSYNLDGGNIGDKTEVDPAKFIMNDVVTVQPDPTREGYSFKGWTVTADNGQAAPVIADGRFVMPAANVTLTANWEEIPFTVSYDLAEGNIDGKTEIDSETFKINDEVTVQKDPVRSGYNFKGWRVTVDNEQIAAPEITADGKFTMPAANVTLTADWEAVPFIPPYNPPTVDPQPLPPDDPLIEPVDPQPLPPDDPLIEEPDEPTVNPQPLPEDEHLIDPTDVEKPADPDQPKTGDEAPLMALGGLFFAAAGALGVIYTRRRTENK